MTADLPLIVVLALQNVSAQNQVPSTQPGWPCVAGRAIDPAYVQTAEATGGQVFLFDRTEAARSMVLVQHSHKHNEMIFRSTGTLMTGSREFNFPVDSTVESLMLSVTLQCLQSITVYRPSNTDVHSGEPDVDDNVFRSGRILILTKPPAGPWRIRISGAGLFFVTVQTKSSISLDRAEFVEPGGRIGHEGLFPVKGAMHPGERRTLTLAITAPAGETTLRLLNSAGEALEQLEVQATSEGPDDREFLATFPLRHADFRVAVEGRDSAGYPYQRVLPRLFQIRD
jgi:von Willebrand factor A domain-containing protein 7